jgi:AcrR family transcriptional regulator
MAARGLPRDDPSVNPRVERTKAHVLRVARDLIVELGPADLTYTALSERSGITRQTLYRHWPTREALMAAIVLTGPDVTYPHPGSDSRTVITGYLRSLRAGLSDPPTGTALLAIAAQADRDPGSTAALHTITADRRAALNELLAGANCQVSEDDFARLCGPIIYWLLIARGPVSDALIRDTVDAWFD